MSAGMRSALFGDEGSNTLSKKKRPTSKRLGELIQASLEDDKAEDLVVIDLKGKSDIADCMLIASGRSSRQVVAMAQHVVEKLKAHGFTSVPVEGIQHGDWVLIDAGDAIIHLFRPEVRMFYNLEKMWGMPLPDSSPSADAAGPGH